MRRANSAKKYGFLNSIVKSEVQHNDAIDEVGRTGKECDGCNDDTRNEYLLGVLRTLLHNDNFGGLGCDGFLFLCRINIFDGTNEVSVVLAKECAVLSKLNEVGGLE